MGQIRRRQRSIREFASVSAATLLALGVIAAPFIIMGGLKVLTPNKNKNLPYVHQFQPVFLSWLVFSILCGMMITPAGISILLWLPHPNWVARFEKPGDSFVAKCFVNIVFLCSTGLSLYLFYLVGMSIMEFGICKVLS